MELFLGVFLGILAGGLIGAISLFILDLYNKFMKRKDSIFSILFELETNLKINDILKNRIENSYEEPEALLEIIKMDKYFEYNSSALRNYFNDLHLILNNELLKKIISTYDIVNFFLVSSKTETYILTKNDIIFLKEDVDKYNKFLNQNKSILEKIESIDVGDVKIDDPKIEDINLNENIDIKTIALTFKKMKYYYEKIINNDEKIIKFYIDILKYWIGNYEKNAKELISNLKENINIKFIIFVNRFFRHYFNKYN